MEEGRRCLGRLRLVMYRARLGLKARALARLRWALASGNPQASLYILIKTAGKILPAGLLRVNDYTVTMLVQYLEVN